MGEWYTGANSVEPKRLEAAVVYVGLGEGPSFSSIITIKAILSVPWTIPNGYQGPVDMDNSNDPNQTTTNWRVTPECNNVPAEGFCEQLDLTSDYILSDVPFKMPRVQYRVWCMSQRKRLCYDQLVYFNKRDLWCILSSNTDAF